MFPKTPHLSPPFVFCLLAVSSHQLQTFHHFAYDVTLHRSFSPTLPLAKPLPTSMGITLFYVRHSLPTSKESLLVGSTNHVGFKDFMMFLQSIWLKHLSCSPRLNFNFTPLHSTESFSLPYPSTHYSLYRSSFVSAIASRIAQTNCFPFRARYFFTPAYVLLLDKVQIRLTLE